MYDKAFVKIPNLCKLHKCVLGTEIYCYIITSNNRSNYSISVTFKINLKRIIVATASELLSKLTSCLSYVNLLIVSEYLIQVS